MASLAPFRALRPVPETAGHVAAVPYDVVNAEEARALAAAYDRLIVTRPDLTDRLTPLSANHKAHIAELSRLIESSPPPSAPASAPAAEGTLSELRTAEQEAQRTAAALARTGPGDRAALLGSIAACRATHAEALR